jgi:hypothetical protein
VVKGLWREKCDKVAGGMNEMLECVHVLCQLSLLLASTAAAITLHVPLGIARNPMSATASSCPCFVEFLMLPGDILSYSDQPGWSLSSGGPPAGFWPGVIGHRGVRRQPRLDVINFSRSSWTSDFLYVESLNTLF